MASFLSFLLLLAVSSASFLSCSPSGISRKELRSKETNQITNKKLSFSVHSNVIDPSRVVQLSWRPRVFLYQDFLSDEECDYLISLVHKGNEKSSSDGNGSGDTITKGQLKGSETPDNIVDEVVSRIEERISTWTFLPKENGKALQVWRYENEDSQKDLNYFGNSSLLQQSKPLIATVILYLSNVAHGGQILFPDSEVKGNNWSDCTKSDNILRPTKGNAILFFNIRPDTTPDPSSSHARCPVQEGQMWCATKLFHAKAIGGEVTSSKSYDDECSDQDENCPRWAAMGECERNPVFMVGSPDYYGTCRKSCSIC